MRNISWYYLSKQRPMNSTSSVIIHKITKKQFHCHFNIEAMELLSLIDDESTEYEIFYNESELIDIHNFVDLYGLREEIRLRNVGRSTYIGIHENMYHGGVSVATTARYIHKTLKTYRWVDPKRDIGKLYYYLNFSCGVISETYELVSLDENIGSLLLTHKFGRLIDIVYLNEYNGMVHKIDTVPCGEIPNYILSKQNIKGNLSEYGIDMKVMVDKNWRI